MKAITLKQPWAFLVCSGVKNIENRTWKCPEKYIGKRVLIHASKTSYRFDNFYDSPLSNDQLLALPDIIQYPTIHSAIIGSVKITGCTINHPSVWAEKSKMIIETPKDGCVFHYIGKRVFFSSVEKAKRFDDVEEAKHVLSIVKNTDGMEKSKIVIEDVKYNWILEDAILFDKPILDVKGKLSFWESDCETLVCPKCGSYCLHNNSDVAIPGWGNPVCECKCGYMIQESEFEFVI